MTELAAPSPDDLRGYLDGRWAEVRERARELAKDPRFAVTVGDDTETQRARVLTRLRALAAADYPRLGFPEKYGGLDDLGGSITGFEMLATGDLSLLVKAGVQWGLFGGAVLHLGAERHHKAYLADIMSLDLLGCFAMTETGHGSDVAELRTTATYDPATGEFEIHTPHEGARKEYIGNAARDGRMAAVFAQLITGGERGWYQEHGRLTAQRAKAVIAEVNRLCAELRPNALLLTEGFGIPDSAIAAPIA
jgi:acyl-CoA oxidase